MQRALKFRRRLLKAWIALLLLLVAGFALGIRNGYETRRMNQWVSRTQETLTESASVRLTRLRMRSDLWFYRATEREEFRSRYELERAKLQASMARLSKLAADNEIQFDAIKRINEAIQEQVMLLDQALEKAQLAKQSGGAQESTGVIPTDDKLTSMMDKFEEEERRLFAERSAEAQRSARWTIRLLSILGGLSCGALLLAGYHVQREILSRAEIEAGLRRARELLGTQLDQQRSDLHHAVEDLSAQILARNAAEAGLKQLNNELETRVAARTKELKEMNQELESFNYSVSHDLRAPLRHMDGFSRILEEEFSEELSVEARHYLGRIRMAAKQMSNLVDDLLQLARFGRQSVKYEAVNLNRMIDETIAACAAEEEERQITWQIAELPVVEADPGLMRQVFANLISNALKFTKNKNPAVIEIGCQRSEREVVLFVKDNGAGFDPKYSDKLFGVFQRLHRQDEFEGTGIGLAIVARIVHRHGGRVWAEGQPDRGATIYFSLIASSAEAKPSEELIGVHL